MNAEMSRVLLIATYLNMATQMCHWLIFRFQAKISTINLDVNKSPGPDDWLVFLKKQLWNCQNPWLYSKIVDGHRYST